MDTFTISAVYKGVNVSVLVCDAPMAYWLCISGDTDIICTQIEVYEGMDISTIISCEYVFNDDVVTTEQQLERIINTHIDNN